MAGLKRFVKAAPDLDQADAFDRHLDKKKKADLGKEAEDEVKAWGAAKTLALAPGFEFWRVPDARTARGTFPAQTGDFACCFVGTKRHAYIEVKETTAVGNLPGKNMDAGQIGRMYKRWQAGAISIVAVRHMKPRIYWVVLPITAFYEVKSPWRTEDCEQFPSAKQALDFGLYRLFNNS